MRARSCLPSTLSRTADVSQATAAEPKLDCPPAVSIGMPAYNSARTIRSAIDSLLGQSFQDLELIISDNASTDDTWSIIQEYAHSDRRVVALRQPCNIGANGNYSTVVRAARGRYFKWASSNDWCAPDFVARCVTYLENHADTVLAAPRTRLFQDTPDVYTDYDCDVAFDDEDAVVRFVRVGSSLALNNVLNGVVRTAVLRRTRLIEHYPGADIVLVGHLALLGKIALLDERLFYRRMDRETATRLMSAEAVHRHHYPRRSLRSLFPAWRLAAGWARAALASDLSIRDLARALSRVVRITYWSSEELRRDFVDALRYSMRG